MKNSMIKTKEEIDLIIQGGVVLGEILEKVAATVAPGVTAAELDALAEKLIVEAGGRPSFKGYASHGSPPFPNALCTSVNDEVVHGLALPTKVLKNGDIIGLDIGMEWPYKKGGDRGYYTDTAMTVEVGKVSPNVRTLVSITKDSLFAAIYAARAGNTIADIGLAVEKCVQPFGYGIVEELVGHGVGYKVHEPPQVPNYFVRASKAITLVPGMVLALEPMITLGKKAVEVAPDEWTIVTRDHSMSAHFEHTIIVTEGEPIIATLRPSEK